MTPSSEHPASAPPAEAATDRHVTGPSGRRLYALRMLHSSSGVAVMSLLMVVQLGLHAKSLAGPGAHIDAITWAHALLRQPPWLLLLAVPVCWHVGWGLWRIARGKYNIARYPLAGGWRYTLQRVSALLALAFIGLHAWVLWLPLLGGSLAPAQAHDALVGALSGTTASVPWLALAYLLGLGACAYHLAVGLLNAATRWGVASTSRARAIGKLLCGVVGMAVLVVGAATVLSLATGWRMLGGGVPPDDAGYCPPAASGGGAP